MRAQEFAISEAIKQRDGVDVEELEDSEDSNIVYIRASAHGRELGRVKFRRSGNNIVALSADVKPEYQGQGIAKIMYDYARELGYRVLRSAEQTDAGRGFWDKYRGEQEVWEDQQSQTLTEYSQFNPAIRKDLEKRGYTFLGQGVDQMAFSEPGTGHVLKIFGTQCKGKNEKPKLSRDQKMFKLYAEFSAKNSSNPHFPRIYGWETFVYPTRQGQETRNCVYLQIRTEKLTDFSRRFQSLFGDMADTVWQGDSFDDFHEETLNSFEGPAFVKWYENQVSDPQSLARMEKLFDTMKILYQIGKKQGFSWDLHGGNIMARADGTPVITDPWVISNDNW
jgi:GNAT superfamily N-acetyltransferase